MGEPFRTLTHCLACGGENLRPYFRAPDQPLANSLTDLADATWPTYPLGLNLCIDCWHSQNFVAVNRDLMFREYAYVSGTSQTLRDYFRQFVIKVETELTGPGSHALRVLDIAANDGTLLKAFKSRGHEVLGVDPAQNLVAVAAEAGIKVLPWYWEMVPEYRLGGKFDVIIAMNVLGHVENPALFLRLAALSLEPGGRIYIQTSQADMVVNAEFDTCYHEHLSFFTTASFSALAERCGLTIVKIERMPIHGTSYLVQLGRDGVTKPRRLATTNAERAAGLYGLTLYDGFQQRVQERVDLVKSTIEIYRAKKYPIVGYGAAAKAITFLNFSGIQIDSIVDENPLKQNRYTTAGTRIEGWTGQWSRATGPILWVVTAWNFAPEIMAKIKAKRPDAKDAFLVYFPQVIVEDPEAEV
jgi:SAM-dependent methyltransferase